MYTKLRDHIRKIFSRFIIKVYLLARRRNLMQVLPMLEKLALEVGLAELNGITANAVPPNGGPLYVLGCSPTVAGDIAKADERSGKFPNIYPGTLPLDGSSGIFQDHHGDTYSLDSLIATRRTLEQVWDFYQSTASDPVPGWTDEDQGGTIGDYMRSSIFELGDVDHDGIPDHNFDGNTGFFTNASLGPN